MARMMGYQAEKYIFLFISRKKGNEAYIDSATSHYKDIVTEELQQKFNIHTPYPYNI